MENYWLNQPAHEGPKIDLEGVKQELHRPVILQPVICLIGINTRAKLGPSLGQGTPQVAATKYCTYSQVAT